LPDGNEVCGVDSGLMTADAKQSYYFWFFFNWPTFLELIQVRANEELLRLQQ